MKKSFISKLLIYIRKYINITFIYKGLALSVACSDMLRAGRSVDRIPMRERFSAPVQTGSGAYPASCTMGTESVSRRVKRPVRGVDHLPQPSAEIKERVELYLLFPVWAFIAVLGWNFYCIVFKCFIKCKILFTYTSGNILMIIGIAFSMLLGPDERLQDCECPVAVWSVISEVHLSSQHPDGYLLLTANKSSGKRNKKHICFLCCWKYRAEENLWFSFEYEIFYSFSEVSVARSELLVAP
jgi:hypothetical protein